MVSEMMAKGLGRGACVGFDYSIQPTKRHAQMGSTPESMSTPLNCRNGKNSKEQLPHFSWVHLSSRLRITMESPSTFSARCDSVITMAQW